ncbi:LacI family DNA-binding transcriptional regulator [Seohaeicola zhoushanensis]|uniref:LacI family transcriptional regulator n=1 Tax=Seohaeicola zhoushanensis TaxID=1569283 RepID=A0A8J3GYZ8_9RHOB|nr:LacI family DNA-binding transcriptional regulator [Seohaeicola zhoushanensis]GHF54998.1 LacI family transcriptional regulator [Seohaeicola zhoushanensis]
MGKPTVHDIAREAGVSLATVDRVLNARAGVREVTVRRVQEAISRIGYVRDLSAANLARQRRYRFAFLLPDTPSQFLKGLHEAIDEAAAGLSADRLEIEVRHIAMGDHLALQQAFRRIESQRFDGVAVMANETPMMRDMIARVKARGLAVVAMITDQPHSERDHFVGIDNLAAGRTAGVLMGRFVGPRAGKIVVAVNSMQARDMVDRRMGFDEVLAERFPGLVALPTIEGRDNHEVVARVTAQCLDNHDGVVGIYCAGAGLRGITEVVRARGLEEKLVIIGHDLTPHSREMLTSGVVDVIINQNAGHIARSAARVLKAQCDGVEVIASQERIRIEIVLKENLPEGDYREEKT